MAQLCTMATLAPIIFLGVAAFLLNVVLSRLVELDRPQIATLKAVGYTDPGADHPQLTMLIPLGGAAGGGLACGVWLAACSCHVLSGPIHAADNRHPLQMAAECRLGL